MKGEVFEITKKMYDMVMVPQGEGNPPLPPRCASNRSTFPLGEARVIEGALDTSHGTLIIRDQWYVISVDWFSRWRAFVASESGPEGTRDPSLHPGKIDNSELAHPTIAEILRPGLIYGQDYVLLHWKGMKMINSIESYQSLGPHFPRKVC